MDGYRDLKVWQLGIEISLATYRVTESLPQREMYGLTSQMRRAAVSIPSNIAEGHSRGQTKDFVRFLAISRGSVSELETQLIIAHKLSLVPKDEMERLMKMLSEESRTLAGLRRSLSAKLRKNY